MLMDPQTLTIGIVCMVHACDVYASSTYDYKWIYAVCMVLGITECSEGKISQKV